MRNKEKVEAVIYGFLSVFSFFKSDENQNRYSKYNNSLPWYFFKSQNYIRLAKEAIGRDEGYIENERNKKVF